MSRVAPVGHHQTVEDYRKRNLLNLLGWRLLAYQPDQIARGEALSEIELALAETPGAPRVHSQDWITDLWAHVARLGEVDKLRRKVRESKAAQRKFVRERAR
jgi:hypothetical protein